MKVLLVDDSGVMRKIIIRSLNELWVKDIVEAGDGVEALQKFGDGAGFDLVLTDWNMPNMNGLELVQAIRGAGHKVPIIMVTTETEKEQVVAAIQAGVNAAAVGRPNELVHDIENRAPFRPVGIVKNEVGFFAGFQRTDLIFHQHRTCHPLSPETHRLFQEPFRFLLRSSRKEIHN